MTRGKKHPYLGMIINFEQPGMVMIENPRYMVDILKKYGEATTVTTPADENLFNMRESPLLSTSMQKDSTHL